MSDPTILNANGWAEWRKYVLASLDELKKQNAQAETKIECNREDFITAINKLELNVTRTIGNLTSEINVLKTKVTQRALLMSAVIAFLPTLGFVLYNIIKNV